MKAEDVLKKRNETANRLGKSSRLLMLILDAASLPAKELRNRVRGARDAINEITTYHRHLNYDNVSQGCIDSYFQRVGAESNDGD
eukprot:2078855-Rhodomonas_salina.2